MKIEIVRAFPSYLEGRNPLEKILAEKTKMIETYQTPRVAKEFYETIIRIFLDSKIPIRKGMLFDREYTLAFQETAGLFLLYLEPNRTNTVAHIQKDSEIAVTLRPAYKIPGLRRDVLLGRNNPYDKMPTGIRINNNIYPLNYGYSQQFPLRRKSS